MQGRGPSRLSLRAAQADGCREPAARIPGPGPRRGCARSTYLDALSAAASWPRGSPAPWTADDIHAAAAAWLQGHSETGEGPPRIACRVPPACGAAQRARESSPAAAATANTRTTASGPAHDDAVAASDAAGDGPGLQRGPGEGSWQPGRRGSSRSPPPGRGPGCWPHHPRFVLPTLLRTQLPGRPESPPSPAPGTGSLAGPPPPAATATAAAAAYSHRGRLPLTASRRMELERPSPGA